MGESSGLNLFDELPDFPSPTEAEMAKFNREDWAEHFFEWHRTVSTLALTFSFIQQTSPAVRRIDRTKFLILAAMLNRCARLMAANLCLASDNRHGDAISILDRCISETAIKARWLMIANHQDRFRRYIANGLVPEIHLKRHILDNIARRGHTIEIERRMLSSIRNSMKAGRVSARGIQAAKKLPSLEAMVREVGGSDLSYTVIQRVGSHAVHGTWMGLLTLCLEAGDNGPAIKKKFNRVHPNQLMVGSVMVLQAIRSFAKYTIKAGAQKSLLDVLDQYLDAIINQNRVMASGDLSRARESRLKEN